MAEPGLKTKATWFSTTVGMIELEAFLIRHDLSSLVLRSIQPLLWLLVFAPIVSTNKIFALPGGVRYIDFLTAGAVYQAATLLAVLHGLRFLEEKNSGILKRLLSGPSPRTSIVFGRSLSSGFRVVIQVIFVWAACLLFGVRFVPNPLYIALALLVVVIFAAGFTCLTIFVASFFKGQESFQGFGQVLTYPLFFASSALYPISIMPPAIKAISLLNPMSYAVDVTRSLAVTGDLTGVPFGILFLLCFWGLFLFLASVRLRNFLD